MFSQEPVLTKSLFPRDVFCFNFLVFVLPHFCCLSDLHHLPVPSRCVLCSSSPLLAPSLPPLSPQRSVAFALQETVC